MTGSGDDNKEPEFDLTPIVRAFAERRSAREAELDAVLASDADREAVTRLLAEAYGQGRLQREDFDARMTGALAARTHGELDDVLSGLGGLPRVAESRPARKVVFWVMTVLLSPFLLLGALLFAFGSDGGDRVGGLFFLGLLLPVMYALWRWAWPRR